MIGQRLLGCVFLAAGLPVVFLVLANLIWLDPGRVRTTGRVVALLSSSVTHTRNDDYLIPGVDPIVEFVAQDGRTYRSEPISCAIVECFSGLRIGSEVPITYSSEYPKLAFADTPRGWYGGLTCILLVGVFACVQGLLVLTAGRNRSD